MLVAGGEHPRAHRQRDIAALDAPGQGMARPADLEAEPVRQRPAAQLQPVAGEDAFLDIAGKPVLLRQRDAGKAAFGAEREIAAVKMSYLINKSH